MLSICSIILVTLPIPIIGRNFLIYYEEFFGDDKPEEYCSFGSETSGHLESNEKLQEDECEDETELLAETSM